MLATRGNQLNPMSSHPIFRSQLPDGSYVAASSDARETFVEWVWSTTTCLSMALLMAKVSIPRWDTETVSNQNVTETTLYSATKSMAWQWIVFGVLGWIAALALTLEKIHVLEHPSDSLSCDLNVFVSCKSVMASWQSHIFGFPNPIIGLAAFVAPILVGVAVLAGAKFADWFWRMFLAGLSLAFVFVLWLSSQSIFVINVLCPYCILAWIAVIPLFWNTLIWMAAEDMIQAPVSWAAFLDAAHKRAWLFTVATEVVVGLLITVHFWDAWPATFAALFG